MELSFLWFLSINLVFSCTFLIAFVNLTLFLKSFFWEPLLWQFHYFQVWGLLFFFLTLLFFAVMHFSPFSHITSVCSGSLLLFDLQCHKLFPLKKFLFTSHKWVTSMNTGVLTVLHVLQCLQESVKGKTCLRLTPVISPTLLLDWRAFLWLKETGLLRASRVIVFYLFILGGGWWGYAFNLKLDLLKISCLVTDFLFSALQRLQSFLPGKRS